MGEKPGNPRDIFQVFSPRPENGAETFPETQSRTLRAAAEGDWSGFFEEYLRPVWNEVVIACRHRNIRFAAAEDIYQELIVRLLRDGQFSPDLKRALEAHDLDEGFRGNLVARYCLAQQLPMRSARFRTFLKQVIRNLILECLRDRTRQPKSLQSPEFSEFEPVVHDTVSESLSRRWIAGALCEATLRLKLDSQQARTRGKRRMFEVMFLSVVEEKTAVEIAESFQLDRSTISELLTYTRVRFIKSLQSITGLTDLDELRETIANSPDSLRAAFLEVGRDDSAPLASEETDFGN